MALSKLSEVSEMRVETAHVGVGMKVRVRKLTVTGAPAASRAVGRAEVTQGGVRQGAMRASHGTVPLRVRLTTADRERLANETLWFVAT